MGHNLPFNVGDIVQFTDPVGEYYYGIWVVKNCWKTHYGYGCRVTQGEKFFRTSHSALTLVFGK